jgi:hypothetical protein
MNTIFSTNNKHKSYRSEIFNIKMKISVEGDKNMNGTIKTKIKIKPS